MMKLRTEIEAVELQAKIDYKSKIFAIGSCFAQRIGAQLQGDKFRVTLNPTGVLFNPASICATIERIANCTPIGEEELLPFDSNDADGGWFHYDFHSSLSAPTAAETLQQINAVIVDSHNALKSADNILITLGTAWVYELCDEKIVANCHKQPAKNFQRRRLSVDEIASELRETISKHLAGKSVILTLSPIRHVADGLSENSLSKSTLRVAIDEVVKGANVEYFPAYEMVVDDLRDYRFYDADMVHPSQVATQYIYDRFCDATMSQSTRVVMERLQQIVRAMNHRAQNPAAQQYKTFCEKQIAAIEEIGATLPTIDLSNELLYFSDKLR